MSSAASNGRGSKLSTLDTFHQQNEPSVPSFDPLPLTAGDLCARSTARPGSIRCGIGSDTDEHLVGLPFPSRNAQTAGLLTAKRGRAIVHTFVCYAASASSGTGTEVSRGEPQTTAAPISRGTQALVHRHKHKNINQVSSSEVPYRMGEDGR